MFFYLFIYTDELLQFFVFFFQAEDGIRDIGVTGVQTCALPIWPACSCPKACPSRCKGGCARRCGKPWRLPRWSAPSRPRAARRPFWTGPTSRASWGRQRPPRRGGAPHRSRRVAPKEAASSDPRRLAPRQGMRHAPADDGRSARSMELRRRLLFAAAAASCASAIARAQPAWPANPVRLLLPDAPGSGNDATARLLAPLLEAALGRPFVVENRPGAGGRIGVEAAWRAAPDGYTFLLGNAGSNGINAAIYRDLPFDLGEAFDPVALLVQGPNVLVANTRALPVRTVAELIALVRARPGQLNYASAGVGSSSHMSMRS